LAFGLAVLVLPLSAAAQTPAQTPASTRPAFQPPPVSKWEVSLYGGSMGGGIPQQGRQILPELSPLTGTVNSQFMRLIPSWFFAWGAAYFGLMATQAQIPERIATLDPLALQPSSERGHSWTAGGRITRVLNPRASVEGSVEISHAPLRLTDASRTAVDNTRTSFPTAWNAFFATNPAMFQNASVNATSAITDGSMSQFSASGAVLINILTRRRTTPYVGMGAGFVRHSGASPTVTLTGRMTMLLNGTTPIDETDSFTLAYDLNRTVVAASIHVGVKRMMNERWGLRAEMREQLSSNPLTHLVTASPSRVLATAPADQGAGATVSISPVQFSNVASTTSTLTGELTNFRAFSGTGMESRLSFTGGIFWRF
jgi:hypothetical protein